MVSHQFILPPHPASCYSRDSCSSVVCLSAHNMFGHFTKSGPRYSLVDGAKRHTSLPPIRSILSVLLVFFAAASCFLAGRYSRTLELDEKISRESQLQNHAPLDAYQFSVRTNPVTFKYDRMYGERPSNSTDQAWGDLFPEQGGFFKHPDLAPKRSALAVFHQLHCLVRQPLPPLQDPH